MKQAKAWLMKYWPSWVPFLLGLFIGLLLGR
jgi:hypothetical protein